MPRKQSLSRSMNRIGGLIHSTLDFDEIMQRVIAEAAQAVGSETAALSLRQGHHWVVRYVHGFPQDVIGTWMDDRQEPHAVLAIETKKPVRIDDALTDERVNRAHLKKGGVRAVLAVPLVTQDEVIGVLSFNRHKAAAPFTDSHVDFASQLASSVSLAVRNARLVGRLRAELAEREKAKQALQEANENREVALANRILRVFLEETGDDLFDKALQIVLEGMDSRHGVFGYIDENGDLVCPSMSKLLAQCEVANRCIRYPRDQWKGLWSQALWKKETLFTNQPPLVPPGHVPIRNNLAAPIVFQGRVIGLLNLANKEGGYTAADTEQIEAITARVAPVLYAWTQSQLREKERREAEAVLRESEKRFRTIFEGNTDGLLIVEAENRRFLMGNRAICRMLGYQPEEIANLRVEDIHRPEDLPFVLEHFEKLARGKEGTGEKIPVRRKDGSVFFADITANPIVLSGQTCLVGSFRDITSRKQMETELRRLNERLEEEVQAQTDDLRNTIGRLQDEVVRRVLAEGKLRQSSRLLEAFFQHTIAPLAFLDRQFHFVRVNEAYARAQGQTPEFFVHKDYFELYPGEEDRAIFEHVVQTKQPYQAYAKLFPFSRSPQQALTYWNWRITPLLDNAGQVQSLVFNLEDVTERQRAFGELEQRARQLQKLTLELAQAEDRERRRLAEILHDDLQQVLAAAKFHLGLLHHRVKSDAEAKELADHLGKMLREAIEKSRSLSHELSPAVLYQSDLGETFEWLARQVQAKHGLTVHTEIHGPIDSPSEPVKAFLFRTAQEILFNAAKHAQVKEARLRLQRRRGQLWLTVADQGRGFDPQTLSQTSGFGLFSIRERVELLGGRMRIRSAKGRGAVFLIAVDDGQKEEKVGSEEGKKVGRPFPASPVLTLSTSHLPRGPRLRILLVDDHKIMRDGLAALIGKQADLEVVGEAGDGRQAVELARGLGPDVVVIDVAMPTMPGDEAARQIKAILPQTRIVALSMFEEPGVAQRMRDAGAEIYLPKTGPSDGLLAAIRGQE